ncbi:MAG TPA: NAD(P)/FAD-dependent oxidoreductase [Patescibacteria group bacterium]|nr:NAD(P)/FAD-dependent oxidoreductase [Patescibacteria group bacterium]
MKFCDVVIIGAGAAGMMCAIEAAQRGRKVLLVDHASAPGEKIRISGGGRCNFTNIHSTHANFLSTNPHFAKSALARYTPADFIKLIEKHKIAYHEKTLGQLFCDVSAKQIINMLLAEMLGAGVRLKLNTKIDGISRMQDGKFAVMAGDEVYQPQSVVIATGGLSIPKMGATGFGYDIARQFGINVLPTRAGLVPLLFDDALLADTKLLSGLSVDPTETSYDGTTFREALLFTHKGISGPSILQISSYWREGEDILVNLWPDADMFEELKRQRQDGNKSQLRNAVARYIPQRLADLIAQETGIDGVVADMSDQKLRTVADRIHRWRVRPTGTEGYRTAEVTLGGVDTDELSSKTMEAKKAPGLFFIGEVVDVTGHLGGHNFQWAWASGWCAGQFA